MLFTKERQLFHFEGFQEPMKFELGEMSLKKAIKQDNLGKPSIRNEGSKHAPYNPFLQPIFKTYKGKIIFAFQRQWILGVQHCLVN